MLKPDWLRIKAQGDENLTIVEGIINRLSLHTVCSEANCPNRMACFNKRTATFMILGSTCTRNCTFCTVMKGLPQPVDSDEPRHVAHGIKELGLKHAVITSVTRDDLPDGGAAHFAETIREIRNADAHVTIEVLIPDFGGNTASIQAVVNAKPDIINHNIETVPRLYPQVRPMAVYDRSIALLKYIKQLDSSIFTKSGIMLGLGERQQEVVQSMKDLHGVHCDFLTIGQYLAPSKNHHPVVAYIHPDIFDNYRVIGEEIGFSYVASAPLVRSSYMADEAMKGNPRPQQ